MRYVTEYLSAFNSDDVIHAALLLLCIGLPVALMVWAMVRNQHREMNMHYCPRCAREREFVRGGECPHCKAGIRHRAWP